MVHALPITDDAPEDEPESENRFAALVNWYDSRLRAGDDPEAGSHSDELLLTETGRNPGELQGVVDCIRLLRRTWGTLGCANPETDSSAPAEGEVWLNRFEIGKEIGRGAFGEVRLARDRVCEREVALKFPRVLERLGIDRRSELLGEAKIAALFTHPGILPVYDLGFSAAGAPYFVMPYCHGGSLADWLRAHPEPFAPKLCARMLLQLADAMQYAHERGVVHRDLKPGNILLQSVQARPGQQSAAATRPQKLLDEWWLKVSDFGLAAWYDPDGAVDKSLRGVVGTLEYMAPEQRAGRRDEVGPASDVYALGLILRELLLGGRAVELERRSSTDRKESSRNDRSIPRDLRRILHRCTAERPEQRYQTAAALAQDLRSYLSGFPVSGSHGPTTLDRIAKFLGRNRSTSILAAGLATLLCVVLFLVAPSRLVREWRDEFGRDPVDVQFPEIAKAGPGEVRFSETNHALAVMGKRSRLAELGVIHPGETVDFAISLIPNRRAEAGVYLGYKTGGFPHTTLQVLTLYVDADTKNFALRRQIGYFDTNTGEVAYAVLRPVLICEVPRDDRIYRDESKPARLQLAIRGDQVVEIRFNDRDYPQLIDPVWDQNAAQRGYSTSGPFGVFVRMGGMIFFSSPEFAATSAAPL